MLIYLYTVVKYILYFYKAAMKSEIYKLIKN